MDLQNKLRSLRHSQVLWAHNLWELLCAGFRHSAGLHARVILDGGTCQPRSLEMCGTYWIFSVRGRIDWRRRGSAHGGRRVREQPWRRHVTHQMTTHLLAHKDDNAIIEPSALVVPCACEQTVLHKCVL